MWRKKRKKRLSRVMIRKEPLRRRIQAPTRDVSLCRLGSLPSFHSHVFFWRYLKLWWFHRSCIFILIPSTVAYSSFWKHHLRSVPWGPSQWVTLSAKSCFSSQATLQRPQAAAWGEGRGEKEEMATKKSLSLLQLLGKFLALTPAFIPITLCNKRESTGRTS